MSAYVVDIETMHKVVRLAAKGGFCRNLAGYSTESGTVRNLDNIGRALFKMNIDAVTQRYPDCVANPENLPGWTGCEEMPTTYRFNDKYQPMTRKEIISAYKAACCLSYQCSEGNIPETVLFRELTTLCTDAAMNIVSNMPEYEAAKWG